MRRRFMGDIYYYTALPRGGEGERGGAREAKHSLSPSFSLPAQEPLEEGVEISPSPSLSPPPSACSGGGGRNTCFFGHRMSRNRDTRP